MPRAEKTVFISYRRKDISWALAVYQYLTAKKYDVFFDYTSIPSGDFEQSILSNIKARAHFLVILTPSALDRCSEPGDWLRREIETAISERRNIIPLFFDDYNFGTPSVSERLSGKLGILKKYNGLEVPAGYFDAAMERLCSRYLNITLDAVLHPVSDEVQEVVKEQQNAANKALSRQKVAEEHAQIVTGKMAKKERVDRKAKHQLVRKLNLLPLGIGGLVIVALACLIFGGTYIFRNLLAPEDPTPTMLDQVVVPANPTNTHLAASTPTSSQSAPVASSTFTSRPPVNTFTPKPPTATSTLGIGSTMISPVDGMVMVYVPAGEFEMGSENGDDDEKPVHAVYLDAFWIDQTEVTNAMFAKFTVDAGYETDAQKTGKSFVYGSSQQISGVDWRHPSGPDSDISNLMEHPTVHVSWNDVSAYCAWAGRRLSTEAEWEKAASWDEKNQRKYVYPWGNSIGCSLVNNGGKNGCFGDTTSVGNYANGQSPYGTYDMAGNVWEWVADWYDVYPNGDPNASTDFGRIYRVLRGGGWTSSDFSVRSTNRTGNGPTLTNFDLGFRCAMSASE